VRYSRSGVCGIVIRRLSPLLVAGLAGRSLLELRGGQVVASRTRCEDATK